MTYIQITTAPAPGSDGVYAQWLPMPGGILPFLTDYVNVDDSLGDAQYIYSVTPNDAVTIKAWANVPAVWPRPTRFDAVRVVAWVRTAGVSSTCSFRLRGLGQDHDSAPYTVTSAAYTEISWLLPSLPDGNGWSITRLNYEWSGFEFGLVFVGGDELRCSKLQVCALEEPYPHWTMVPSAAGTQSDWLAYPSTAAPWTTLQRYDGDESYCYSATGGDISVFPHDPMGVPFPTVIDKIRVAVLVKNMSSTAQTVTPVLRLAGVDYRGGCDTLGSVVAPDGVWHLIFSEYSTDPSLAWPAGNPAGGLWTQAQINATEIGFENTSGGDIRVTSLAMEVFLTPPGSTVIDWFPTANGFHTDFPPVVPNVGEAAWEDVDEDPPDDAASYIEASATVSGAPQYCSFTMGGAGAPGANERIYLVELTARIRLGNLPHSMAEIVPVARDILTGRSYFGQPITVEDTGVVWFDVKWNYWNNPWTGCWHWGTINVADPAMYEFGIGVLQGDVLVSRIRTRILTCPDYPSVGVVDPIDMQLTDLATVTYMPRSILDGTLYAVTEFAVGVGGYSPAAPGTVTPVNTADVTLINEIWRGPLTHVQYDAAILPWTVQYYCRIPRDTAIQGIGEIGLIAEILWSPFPWEIGTKFLFALQHMPLLTRHEDTVGVHVLQVTYP